MYFDSKFLILTPFYAFSPHFESDLTHSDLFSTEKVSFFLNYDTSKRIFSIDFSPLSIFIYLR